MNDAEKEARALLTAHDLDLGIRVEHDESIRPDGKTFRLVTNRAFAARRRVGSTQRPMYLATVYSAEEAQLLARAPVLLEAALRTIETLRTDLSLVAGRDDDGVMLTLGSLRGEISALTKQRDTAIAMLAAWCLAVEEDSSWDGWDEHYKDAGFRPCTIRDLIDAELEVQRAENYRRTEALKGNPNA